MARLDRMPEPMRSHLANLPCPSFKEHPWAAGHVLRMVKERCMNEKDEALQVTGARLLIPLELA